MIFRETFCRNIIFHTIGADFFFIRPQIAQPSVNFIHAGLSVKGRDPDSVTYLLLASRSDESHYV